MALNTLGSNRDQLLGLALQARQDLIQRRVLVEDPRRSRPRWFDGRFLAASDLQAEQNYLLVRQADLGRAAGTGIVEGLDVALASDDTTGVSLVEISPGHGLTSTGELIVVPEGIRFNPADVPEIQRLDAAFGLQVIPTEPGRSRTGLYILALRAVEWTAKPIGAYPTSLTGTRTVEDGVIVEGVAVTLIPYPENGGGENPERRRARIAREIFVEGRDRGQVSQTLPLALVALRGNLVEWIDPYLVRRETGSERPAGMDFGFGARALREAHLLQYEAHLADALDANHDQPFSATAYFDALPPLGRFPAAALDPDALTQRFFPPGIQVDLAPLPADELPALIEESLLLPPFDLTQDRDALAGTAVVVLVPLARAEYLIQRAALTRATATLRTPIRVLKADLSPLARLMDRVRRPVPIVTEPPADEAAWRELVRLAQTQNLLWYVRRRYLPIPVNTAGTGVSANNVRSFNPRGFTRLAAEHPTVSERLEALGAIRSPAITALTSRLTESRLVEHPALIRSILDRVPATAPETRLDEVVAALAPLGDPRLGVGLSRLSEADKTLGQTLESKRLADSGLLPEVDKLAREVAPENFEPFTAELKKSLRAGANLADGLANARRKFVTA